MSGRGVPGYWGNLDKQLDLPFNSINATHRVLTLIIGQEFEN
jgi:hypothetical protein